MLSDLSRRRTEDKTFDCLVPEVQGFRQSVFQGFPSAWKIFWAGVRVAFNQKSLAGVLVAVPLKTIVKIRFKVGIVVYKRND
jgi:hypothetical protein